MGKAAPPVILHNQGLQCEESEDGTTCYPQRLTAMQVQQRHPRPMDSSIQLISRANAAAKQQARAGSFGS
jgi:hypothetical protein